MNQTDRMEITYIPICMCYKQKETVIAKCKIHSEEGQKTIFIDILNPHSASYYPDGVSDLTYVELIVKRWSHNNAFLLRENMEIYEEKDKYTREVIEKGNNV